MTPSSRTASPRCFCLLIPSVCELGCGSMRKRTAKLRVIISGSNVYRKHPLWITPIFPSAPLAGASCQLYVPSKMQHSASQWHGTAQSPQVAA